MRIGMFHIRKDPSKVTRAYLYAAIAKLEGIEFFYFTSRDIDFKHQCIQGSYYEEGTWKKKEFPFPDVVMNAGYPITEGQKERYDRLKKMIPFTAHPVGNKLEVYRRIEEGESFKEYIIPYQEVTKPQDVIEFLRRYPEAIMKPIIGHHGDHIVYMERRYYDYRVRVGSKVATISEYELLQFIQRMQGIAPMLVQKFIPCKRKSGEPYDIRILLTKNGEGKWDYELYGKIGSDLRVATNVNKGGQVTLLSNLLINEFGDRHHEVKRYLEVFALQFANHFEHLYPYSFDELGIDIGLDENQKIWIYEVNWHPGQLLIESKGARNAVLYAKYLAHKIKRRNRNETIIT